MNTNLLEIAGEPDGKGLRIAIVASRFNEEIVSGLIKGAISALEEKGVREISLLRVPGAFELPALCGKVALDGAHEAVIALGAVIKGETDHYRYICESVTRGLTDVALHSPVPVLFGVLTTENEELALKRSDSGQGNKGREAAISALEMISLYRKLRGEV